MKDQTLNEPKWVEELANFYGTENHYKYGFLGYKLTDGTKFLAKKAECFWLYDIICSVVNHPRVRGNTFQKWRIEKQSAEATKAKVICSDGDRNNLYTQKIGFTDFPLKEFELYCVDKVIMLKSEY